MSLSQEYPLDEIADDWFWGIGEVAGESTKFPFYKENEYRGTVYTEEDSDWAVILCKVKTNKNGDIIYREMIESSEFLSYEDAMEYVSEITEKYNNE